jgi:hypothetical protein
MGPVTEANVLGSKGTNQTVILEVQGNLTPPGLLFCRKPALTRKPVSAVTRMMEVLFPKHFKNKIIYIERERGRIWQMDRVFGGIFLILDQDYVRMGRGARRQVVSHLEQAGKQLAPALPILPTRAGAKTHGTPARRCAPGWRRTTV